LTDQSSETLFQAFTSMFSRKSSMFLIGRSIPVSHDDDKVDGFQYGFVLCSLGTHRTEAGRNIVWRLPWSTTVLWRCSEGRPLFNRSPRVGHCLLASYLYLFKVAPTSTRRLQVVDCPAGERIPQGFGGQITTPMSRLISLISRQLARSLPKTRLQTAARSYLSRYAPATRRICCGRLTPGVDWKWIQRILASVYRGLCIRGPATKGFCRYPWSVVWVFFESVRSAERWYRCSYDNQWCVAGRPFHKCWYLWSVWRSSCRKAD